MRNELRSQAKQAFDAEMARKKSGDCRDANNTYESNVCLGKSAELTAANLKAFEQAIRVLLGLHNPGVENTGPGPAGPTFTPEQNVAEFEHVEQVWHSYLDAAATAAFHQFGGGTGGPSFELETRIRLTRDHMEALNDVYFMALRM